MNWKTILTIILLIFMVFLLWGYFFMSFSDVTFLKKSESSNFSFGFSNSSDMLFYNNLRYPYSNISYKISDACTLQKKADAEGAFSILADSTILDFYPVESGENILIGCKNRQKVEGDFFVAGEGGPVNVTKSGDFSVISYGEVLLMRNSDCPNPNIALHEILHSLGFKHSLNSGNIMYNVSDCSQVMGPEIPQTIEELYSIPSLSDLVVLDVSPNVHGRNLDLNLTIKNEGLVSSKNASLKIYVDGRFVNSLEIPPLSVGAGVKFKTRNIGVGSINLKELKIVAESDFDELIKENNEVVFLVKK